MTQEQVDKYLDRVASLSDKSLLKIAENVPQHLFAVFMYHPIIGERLTKQVRNRLQRSENAQTR